MECALGQDQSITRSGSGDLGSGHLESRREAELIPTPGQQLPTGTGRGGAGITQRGLGASGPEAVSPAVGRVLGSLWGSCTGSGFSGALGTRMPGLGKSPQVCYVERDAKALCPSQSA